MADSVTVNLEARIRRRWLLDVLLCLSPLDWISPALWNRLVIFMLSHVVIETRIAGGKWKRADVRWLPRPE